MDETRGSRLGSETNRFRALCAELIDGLRRETAGTMRSIESAHRAIVFTAMVKMNANLQHLLERRLQIDLAIRAVVESKPQRGLTGVAYVSHVERRSLL